MWVSTIVMLVLALVLLAVAQHTGQQREGIRASTRMIVSLAPLLLLAFLVAGYVQVLLPQEQVGRWLGAGMGWRGPLLGTAAGALCPGGPFVSMPLAAGLFGAGAGLGTIVAFMTSWSLLGVNRLPMEMAILGWHFTAIRYGLSLVVPPLAGMAADLLFGSRFGSPIP